MRSIESGPGPYNGERVHSVFDGGVGGLAPSRYIGRRGYRPLARAAVPGEARFTVGGGAPGKSPQAGIYDICVLSEGDWSATITSNDAQ